MSRRVALRREDWPEADCEMWAALFATGDPLDDAGPLASLRETSRASLQARYARWLAWLAAEEPAALAEPPGKRVDPRRLAAWMEGRADLAPMSRLMHCDAVLRVATAAEPDADWSAQRRLQRRLRREARAAHGDRKHGRVLSTAVLLDAALDLAGAQAETATTELQALQRRRDGAMLAVLALMPMRLRAFVELRLGRSVLVDPGRIRIALSAGMTKTGAPWEAEVPTAAAAPLRGYVDEVRPIIAARGGGAEEDRLWLGDRGRPYGVGHLSQRVQAITECLLGVRVPPQFFRDAAATTLARTSPEAARLTRGLLGHAGFRTAERHYNQARDIRLRPGATTPTCSPD